MFMLKDAFDEVVDATLAKRNPELQTKIMVKFNQWLRYIARKDSMSELRRKLEISYDGDPVQLPPNFIGADLVWDDTNSIEYIDRNRSDSEAFERMNRYFTYPIGSSLAKVSDVSIQQDGTTFSSDDLLALDLTTDDEWFYVEGEEQYYQITSNVDSLYTFSPAYRGTGSRSSAVITVRPASTLMLDIVGSLGAEVPTTTIDLYYWIQPDLLRDMSDMVPLSTSYALVSLIISHMPEAKKSTPISQNQVKEAISELLADNPDKPRARVMRGHNRNRIFDRGNPYGSRNQGSTTNFMGARWPRNLI